MKVWEGIMVKFTLKKKIQGIESLQMYASLLYERGSTHSLQSQQTECGLIQEMKRKI